MGTMKNFKARVIKSFKSGYSIFSAGDVVAVRRLDFTDVRGNALVKVEYPGTELLGDVKTQEWCRQHLELIAE